MLYLLNLRKHANQTELDQFFKHRLGLKQATQVITKSAFFQARKQLNASAFVALNRLLVNDVYKSKWQPKKWHGFRLCAIDGTSIRLPNEPDIINHFGVHNGRKDQSPCAIGMASVFYDVLNKIVIDSAIHPRLTAERECAKDHLAYSTPNDLILFDRGYTSFWLYTFILQRGLHFCVRATTRRDNQVKAFIASGKKQAIVTYHPSKRSEKICEQKGLSSKPIKLRLIRVELPGEVEVLMTNLMDEEAYPSTLFKKLYHLRWGIEENYKRLKQWLEIENFSGKSALSIEQDFYAKIVASNLVALLTIEAQAMADKRTQYRQLHYQINAAQALSKMKHQVVALLTINRQHLRAILRQTIEYISYTVEAKRDGRHNIRRLKNIKNDIHYPAYKSAL